MRLIDADALYEQLKQDEEMARNRVLDTKSSLPYPNNLNPSYTRYVAQMNERTRLKHMVADAPTIEPEPKKGKRIVINKFEDCCYAKCNQCNVTQVFYYNKPLTNFCPNCGAKMEGEYDG